MVSTQGRGGEKMFTEVEVANFRSIESTKVRLAPLTVLYGPTGSGKSSFSYALCVIRNFLANPNQGADGLFNLGFLNLGGYTDCVYNHETERSIRVEATYHVDNGDRSTYRIDFNATGADLNSSIDRLGMTTRVPLPYSANQSNTSVANFDGADFTITWNGISSTVAPKDPSGDLPEKATQIAVLLNAAPEALRKIDIVPPARGFFKPLYSPVAAVPYPISEDEVATTIMTDRYLKPRISGYLSSILGRNFDVHTPPGTATAYFQTTDETSITPVNLVNDAHGVNQIVYLLAKILRQDVRTVIIEEPEVHLHPKVIQKFAKACIEFFRREQKQLIVTTHSSAFLTALAASVVTGELGEKDICLLQADRTGRKTKLLARSISKEGQIEGGLGVFDDPSIEDLKAVLASRKSANV